MEHVRRLAQRMGAFHQHGAAHREDLDCQAQLRVQVRVVPASEADRQVVVVAGEVRRPRIGRHADVDLRVGLDETVQPWDQPLGSEGGRDVHAQHGSQFRAELPGGVGQEVERLLHRRQVGPPGGGQRQRLGFPQEQGNAKVLLQCLDLVAHRRRRDEHLLGRPRETRVAGGDLEGPQGVQRGK